MLTMITNYYNGYEETNIAIHIYIDQTLHSDNQSAIKHNITARKIEV